LDWEKQKYLLDLELERVHIEKERRFKWIGFIQTVFLLTASATISLIYKFYKDYYLSDIKPVWFMWIILGMILSLLLIANLLWNFRKIKDLKEKIERIKKELQR